MLTTDRGPAARAGLAGSAVGVQRVREVAGLPIDVHVLRVEARAALGEGFVQHRADLGEQAVHSTRREGRRWSLRMQAGCPQRLIGIDVETRTP